MNPVAQLLSRDDVFLDLEVANKQQLFETLGTLLAARHQVDHTLVTASLNAREQLGSTGLGHGVAIPHARIAALPKQIVAFARTRAPLPFDSADGKPVSNMMVFLVPEHATDEHLRLLGTLAKMFCDKTFLNRIKASHDADEIVQLFGAWREA